MNSVDNFLHFMDLVVKGDELLNIILKQNVKLSINRELYGFKNKKIAYMVQKTIFDVV